MSFQVDIKTYRKWAIVLAIVSLYIMGFSSSSQYSERLPITREHFWRDILVNPFLNPLALLNGVLIYRLLMQMRHFVNTGGVLQSREGYFLLIYASVTLGLEWAMVYGILVY